MNFISETKETYSVSNLSEFCRENNLDLSAMHKVIKGTRKTHKGFKLAPETQSDKLETVSKVNQTHEITETQSDKIRLLELELQELKNSIIPLLTKFSSDEKLKRKNSDYEETSSRMIFGKK